MPDGLSLLRGDNKRMLLQKYLNLMISLLHHQSLSSLVVSALAFHPRARVQFPVKANLQINFFSFSSSSSYRNHQTFLIRLATFKITQILSPERASERKGMSTIEQFIWVNLYSLDLSMYLGGSGFF